MTASTFANILPFAVLVACLFRARLLALSLVPPCALIITQWFGLVDTSSASHPLRWIVPVSCAGLAFGAFGAYRMVLRSYDEHGSLVIALSSEQALRDARTGAHRALVASLFTLAACAPDLLALHPFFWVTFSQWPLVPLQIAVCVTILGVLWAPERWVEKCLTIPSTQR